MQPVRASEISSYLYCGRAWWYQQQGEIPGNKHQLNLGNQYHQTHGRDVLLVRALRAAAWILLLAALVILASALTSKWLD